MGLSWKEIEERALRFSGKWKDAKDEVSESQSFLNDFFEVFGIDRKRTATFEFRVPIDGYRSGYIDMLWKGLILVEMKSKGKSLNKAFDQAKDYAFRIENDNDLPKYIMVSDFDNIRLYNLSNNKELLTFKTSTLHTKVKWFAEIAGYTQIQNFEKEKNVDIKAALKMAKLHEILSTHGYTGHQLEMYLVRLIFCLFADDTSIFEKNIFREYIAKSKKDGSDLSERLSRLFEVLNTSPMERSKMTILRDELKEFSYINGKLFEETIKHADFNESMRTILLDACSLDWGNISPAIFGSIFQGVMNENERRHIGAHYTSEENILKVIKPLFLDDLWQKFELYKNNSKLLEKFHISLSKIKFLDPACGCGNFLIVAYRELRKIEFEILKINTKNLLQLDLNLNCLVNVQQFYGIEIEEFPCQIAQVGMWLVDHQMNMEISEYFANYFIRLPLVNSATILNTNALTYEWSKLISNNELSYIFGNPPFIGAMNMNEKQRDEIRTLFGNISGVGEFDYVSGWYKKALEFMKNTSIHTSFVSTNSICQGQHVITLWNHLFNVYNIKFSFAYKPFVWSNEAKNNAAVHCVIVGFKCDNAKSKSYLYDKDFKIEAKNITPYLYDGTTVFLESRNAPISNAPKMRFGSMPRDGGGFILDSREKDELIINEPISEKWIKLYLGADELLNKKHRWCLWLENADPTELKKCPEVLRRIEHVKQFRLKSKAKETRKFAETPSVFCQIAQPKSDYLAIPRVSSERRVYIPIGFLSKNVIASDLLYLIPDATLYHFGIITSSVHMIWMRKVAGRMKSDYRYSKDIVYNNFVWPEINSKIVILVEEASNVILNIRANYPASSLSDLYDPNVMPKELLNAHHDLDRLVKKAYKFKGNESDEEIVEYLFKLYLDYSKSLV